MSVAETSIMGQLLCMILFYLFSDISWRPAEEQRLKRREHDFRHICKLAISFLQVLPCLKRGKKLS